MKFEAKSAPHWTIDVNLCRTDRLLEGSWSSLVEFDRAEEEEGTMFMGLALGTETRRPCPVVPLDVFRCCISDVEVLADALSSSALLLSGCIISFSMSNI